MQWKVDFSFDRSVYRDIWTATDFTGHREHVALILDTDDTETARRNARLIAAAPDLLATLEKVAAFWAGGDVPADLHAEMLAVIRQAKGAA